MLLQRNLRNEVKNRWAKSLFPQSGKSKMNNTLKFGAIIPIFSHNTTDYPHLSDKYLKTIQFKYILFLQKDPGFAMLYCTEFSPGRTNGEHEF